MQNVVSKIGELLSGQEGPSCVGETYQISLVPWSCSIDDDTALLSCTPAYLTYTRTAGNGMPAGSEIRFVVPKFVYCLFVP